MYVKEVAAQIPTLILVPSLSPCRFPCHFVSPAVTVSLPIVAFLSPCRFLCRRIKCELFTQKNKPAVDHVRVIPQYSECSWSKFV